MNMKLSVSVTGDSLTITRLPKDDPKLLAIRDLLLKSDVRFTNLESSIHNYEDDIYPSRHSGGDWIAAPPSVLADLGWLGFNLMGAPNNHSLDWSHQGLLKTMENLDREGIVYAGIGKNLSDASRPKYLETSKGRVALIAVNTSFRDWHPAGEQRRDFIGRPGINALGFMTVHRVREEELNCLKLIAGQTEINKRITNQAEEIFKFGDQLFEIGEPGTYTKLDEMDEKRIRKSIKEAQRQADIVLVSCHSHEMKGSAKEQLADFQREFAHMCIDEGAHAYIGHGPHVLRGIEIYKERPIFHGLGDFFYQCELIEKAPTEFYEKFGNLSSDQCTADGYDYRIASGGILGETNPKFFESIIASFDVIDGNVQNIVIYPVSLGFNRHRSRKGSPGCASAEDGERILAEMRELSVEFGTRIRIENGVGIVG
ncbi:CapA family protein [Desulfosporosinus sp. PR]|uniref:CapA family protein n=1 Tax=Candidatus Desulfosporosinus nitrosoreducens TaxID=3401928 RepID=UPI0027ED5CDB|nr:CapA family protein [Desulfosporosinus sp. PR]MDQ7092639.1 CapA family protein [Desulfosporosinus sp. PR]